jgi:hypothetical protein
VRPSACAQAPGSSSGTTSSSESLHVELIACLGKLRRAMDEAEHPPKGAWSLTETALTSQPIAAAPPSPSSTLGQQGPRPGPDEYYEQFGLNRGIVRASPALSQKLVSAQSRAFHLHAAGADPVTTATFEKTLRRPRSGIGLQTRLPPSRMGSGIVIRSIHSPGKHGCCGSGVTMCKQKDFSSRFNACRTPQARSESRRGERAEIPVGQHHCRTMSRRPASCPLSSTTSVSVPPV